MENNGQLTFNDDPILPGINSAFSHLETGEFSTAVKEFSTFLDENPDYPGLADGYRTARFWENRSSDIKNLKEGRQTADFFMKEWEYFDKYCEEKNISQSNAYRAVQKFIFFTASEHYKIAFKNEENPTDNFNLLINLADCFLGLEEYKHAAETLEYCRSAYKTDTRLTTLLAESYFHLGEIPKSLLLFREAFFLNPQEIDMKKIKSEPIRNLYEHCVENISPDQDPREWIPVFAYLSDTFYVKHQLSNQAVDSITKDIYSLEKSYQMMSEDKLSKTNIIPRLINKYLWMYDYFNFQKYDFEALTDIRSRLIEINKDLFEPFFKNKKNN